MVKKLKKMKISTKPKKKKEKRCHEKNEKK